jgi:Dolichyl-phosphate-mannose-protein mannosyltransferase
MKLSLKRETIFLLGAALLILTTKIWFLGITPLRSLTMSVWLIDDSFITMRVARNIALGHGFSFDGIHPTTGVSPLWTYLTALTHFAESRDLAAKLTVIASACFGTISTLLTYGIARKATASRPIAWTAFLLASFMPVTFFNAMNGMETSFFTSLILAGIYAFLSSDAGQPAATFKRGCLIGLAFGLALLARADAIFAIAALGLTTVAIWSVRKEQRRTLMTLLLGMGAALVVCVLVMVLWQWMQTGSLHPDNQVGRRYIAWAKHGFVPGASSASYYLKIVIWNTFELNKLWIFGLGSSLLGILCLLYAFTQPRLRALASFTSLYVVLFGFALVAYQWYFPDFHGLRYLNTGIHLLLIIMAAALVQLFPSRMNRTLLLTPFCVVLLILSWYSYFDLARQPKWAKDMTLFGQSSTELQNVFWGAIDCVNKTLPPDTVIAARDHGRLAYFTDRPVQDFAGILDPDVLPAYEKNELAAYLAQRNASYIFLPEKTDAKNIFQSMHRSLSLELVPECPAQDSTQYRLYRIKR